MVAASSVFNVAHRNEAMDPQAAWNDLVLAYEMEDWPSVDECAMALLNWLKEGGFPPQTTRGRTLSDKWNRAVVNAACHQALSDAWTADPEANCG